MRSLTPIEWAESFGYGLAPSAFVGHGRTSGKAPPTCLMSVSLDISFSRTASTPATTGHCISRTSKRKGEGTVFSLVSPQKWMPCWPGPSMPPLLICGTFALRSPGWNFLKNVPTLQTRLRGVIRPQKGHTLCDAKPLDRGFGRPRILLKASAMEAGRLRKLGPRRKPRCIESILPPPPVAAFRAIRQLEDDRGEPVILCRIAHI
jgi:hypothetical protein